MNSTKSATPKLQEIDASKLDIAETGCDLYRDLHVFVNYVRERRVKRATRTNWLGKADARRLAKVMSDASALEEIEEHGYSGWIDTVDTQALELGFIKYDTKGSYAGYTSSEPSFPDNYIEFNEARYEEYLHTPLAHQVQLLYNSWVRDPSNEFFNHTPLGRLSVFSGWGSATGVMPSLDFPAVRQTLFAELAKCQPGVWYSVDSLTQHMKKHHPYFIIPEFPRYERKWEREKGRYGNFHESRHHWGHEIEIKESEPDAFERVEGRYIERFLEGIPHLLKFVDVAYAPEVPKGIYPSRGYLQAFRLRDLFFHFKQVSIEAPKVTVQPNYEIQVETEIYPANVLDKLDPLVDLISDDAVTVLRLQKQKVIAALAHDPTLDVVKLLTDLSGRTLPQNIQAEIDEWAGHSENFILYDGFGLLESSKEKLTDADPFTVETISPNLRIVHSSELLYLRLEKAEQVPLRIMHTEKTLRPLPAKAKTVFRTQAQVERAAKKPRKKALKLLRKIMVTLHFPNQADLDAIHQALVRARCPVEVDRANLTLRYANQHEAEVTAVFKTLADTYNLKLEDIE